MVNKKPGGIYQEEKVDEKITKKNSDLGASYKTKSIKVI